jgi:hypothetical protein
MITKKITLNELRNLVKDIIKEETEDKWVTKKITNGYDDAVMNTHFAIHKPTNGIARMWDYSSMLPKKPTEPSDKNNKRAMTMYKNKMEEYKVELKEVISNFNQSKDEYFYDDLKYEIGANMDKFNKSDFLIVQKDGLSKYNIDLKNYLLFIGEK